MPSGLYPDQGRQTLRQGRDGSGDATATTAELNPVTPPSLTLPKGGGAIRGIGETY